MQVTGNAVVLSDSAGSVTKHCQLYENLLEPGTPAWLDTVGWEDRTKDDKETFREILAFIHHHQMAELLAVVWCVAPGVRTDASLRCDFPAWPALARRQAEFIDKLKAGEIWDNVIVVVKQSVNPKYDARGALAATRDFAAADTAIKVMREPKGRPSMAARWSDTASPGTSPSRSGSGR
jgi:hypothetical protein